MTSAVAVLPFDATNGHGNLTKNLTISRRRECRGMAISGVSSSSKFVQGVCATEKVSSRFDVSTSWMVLGTDNAHATR